MLYLDGVRVANEVEKLCASVYQKYLMRHPQPIALGVLRVGENPASILYIQRKKKVAERLGFIFQERIFSEHESQEKILDSMNQWLPDLDGLIIQLPLPHGHDSASYLSAVPVGKDVDGLNPNFRKFVACTPLGCLFLLTYYDINVHGQHCVIVGKSDLVGRPLAELLMQQQATVTVTHKYTKNLSFFTQQAEILFVCAGHKHLIQQKDVQEHAIVIDIGIHQTDDGITGDVSPDIKVRAISPVPGGIGPLTVMGLMWNTLTAAFEKHGESLSLSWLLHQLELANDCKIF
jgi:methylenetetrahydrofolate dehydrogenase (NADP+)/methenyltetrahydrofolate cyclohydrolase